MTSTVPHPSDAPIQAAAWARAQANWARGTDLPWLHREIAQRMADRLPIIRSQPQHIIEWDADAGQSRAALLTVYPQAQVVAVSPVAARKPAVRLALPPPSSTGHGAHPPHPAPSLRQRLAAWSARWWGPSPGQAPSPQPSAAAWPESAVPPGQAQLLWSNLGLHTCAQPGALLRRWHEALAVDGFLMFSTLGPDTLKELRVLWADQGWGPPSQDFRDMHDWGDDLVAAGFADPVMDQETITLTWASPEAALAELRTLGRNAHPGRSPGLRTPAWKARVLSALQDRADEAGRIGLRFEIIYGHAFRPAPRPRLAPETAISLDEMRTLVQSARRPL